MKKFGIKEVVATGIGTALFVVLTEVQIPLGVIPNTSLQPRAAVLAFLAAVFGPVVGGIIGLLGHALGDALFYGGVWWSWVFPDAIFGILVGLFVKKYQIKEGGFHGKNIALFNAVQVIANADKPNSFRLFRIIFSISTTMLSLVIHEGNKIHNSENFQLYKRILSKRLCSYKLFNDS